MAKAVKTRASKQAYSSPNQLTLVGFESPFSNHLNPGNRWVVLSHKIPWDVLVNVYQKQLNNSETGADGINPRVVIGSLIIKHMCDLSDRETVQQIQENMYMQYFIGYSSFSDQEPFDPSLFVEFRKRLGAEQINAINEKILHLSTQKEESADSNKEEPPLPPAVVAEEPLMPAISTPQPGEAPLSSSSSIVIEDTAITKQASAITHAGKLIVDATACPQDIGYPTDLNLLNDSREKAEELIDLLYFPSKHGKKPRTYREKARKDYLKTAQKKRKTKSEIRNALRKQLCYLKRDIKSIYRLLESYEKMPFNRHQYKYFLVIQTLYDQQAQMYQQKVHSVEHRIVSIHQPHVRPIVRGKTNANAEFGAKIQVSLMQGFAFLEDLSWEAFNEGTRLMNTVEQYKTRFGYYPKEVLVDKIYCNRDNRANLKEKGIVMVAKPLGRPKAVQNHIRPGERNPIEGKFGQAKTAYGMNRIKARLQQTSESWIATIIMVLNLVKLTGLVSYWVKLLTYSALVFNKLKKETQKLIGGIMKHLNARDECYLFSRP
jgi:hypothetical protein